MIRKHVLNFLALLTILSCNKENKDGGTYIVNAIKVIGMARNNWSNVEPQLINKTGYQ